MDKVPRYLQMVVDRKKCHRCTGLENPATYDSEFDSDEVGPWTLWQGNLDAAVMVVGQDWGDTGYYLKHKGREGKKNPTNLALAELLGIIGVTIGQPDDPKPDRGPAFFTNAVLCLKTGGLQGNVESDWFRNCGGRFLKPSIDLVKPKILITLGERASRAVADAYDLPCRAFRDEVDAASGRELPNGVQWFPMYHCGKRIQNTHRPYEQQKKDWQRVRLWLEVTTA